MRAPIAGAHITVTADSTQPRSTISNERGEFSITVPSGRYTVTVAADGFAAVSRIVDSAAEAKSPDEFVLPVAGVRETVNVAAPTVGYQVPAIAQHQDTDAAA
jgi:hypothetical protein